MTNLDTHASATERLTDRETEAVNAFLLGWIINAVDADTFNAALSAALFDAAITEALASIGAKP